MATELVHEAFLHLHRHWASVDRPGGYVRTTLVDLCRGHHRRRLVADRNRAEGREEFVQDGVVSTTGFTAQLDANGRVVIESSVPVDVAVDVAGFYRAPNAFDPADSYWPTTPTVVADGDCRAERGHLSWLAR